MPSTRTPQLASLALLHSAPSTIICLRSACCLRLLHACRVMHPPDAAIRAARLSPIFGSPAAPQAVEPGILTPAVPAPQRPASPPAVPERLAAPWAPPRLGPSPPTRIQLPPTRIQLCRSCGDCCRGAALRLLRLRLSAGGSQQATPLHACHRDMNPTWGLFVNIGYRASTGPAAGSAGSDRAAWNLRLHLLKRGKHKAKFVCVVL